jgi:hypothetical protein
MFEKMSPSLLIAGRQETKGYIEHSERIVVRAVKRRGDHGHPSQNGCGERVGGSTQAETLESKILESASEISR